MWPVASRGYDLNGERLGGMYNKLRTKDQEDKNNQANAAASSHNGVSNQPR
jgi:hypothetical protein